MQISRLAGPNWIAASAKVVPPGGWLVTHEVRIVPRHARRQETFGRDNLCFESDNYFIHSIAAGHLAVRERFLTQVKPDVE
jgi:hypothetical protein